MNLKRTVPFVFLLCATAAYAQTMHLVTISDSNDANIGTGTAANTRGISEFLVGAATELQLTMNRQDVSGKAFDCRRIREAVRAVRPAPNDIVVFYYSGHGFRSSTNATKFPELYCGEEAFTGDAPRLFDVAAELAGKGARLTIVVADSCNVLLTQPAPDPRGVVSSILGRRADQYRNLFMKHKGTITLSGSVPGQFSWYYPKGGLFTTQLLEALDTATRGGRKGLWSDVMKVALTEIKVPYGNTTIPQTPESDVQVEVLP